MDEQPPACPSCNGAKLVWVQISPDQRVEDICPACNGTGLLSDALVAKFTGEDQERKDKVNDILSSKFWRRQGGRVFVP